MFSSVQYELDPFCLLFSAPPPNYTSQLASSTSNYSLIQPSLRLTYFQFVFCNCSCCGHLFARPPTILPRTSTSPRNLEFLSPPHHYHLLGTASPPPTTHCPAPLFLAPTVTWISEARERICCHSIGAPGRSLILEGTDPAFACRTLRPPTAPGKTWPATLHRDGVREQEQANRSHITRLQRPVCLAAQNALRGR